MRKLCKSKNLVAATARKLAAHFIYNTNGGKKIGNHARESVVKCKQAAAVTCKRINSVL